MTNGGTYTFRQPAPEGLALEPKAPLTLSVLRSKPGQPGTGTGPFFWTRTSGKLPQLEIPADNPHHRSLHLDPRISPVIQNVLYFQSQQTEHTDFTTGEPFQTLKDRYTK